MWKIADYVSQQAIPKYSLKGPKTLGNLFSRPSLFEARAFHAALKIIPLSLPNTRWSNSVAIIYAGSKRDRLGSIRLRAGVSFLVDVEHWRRHASIYQGCGGRRPFSAKFQPRGKFLQRGIILKPTNYSRYIAKNPHPLHLDIDIYCSPPVIDFGPKHSTQLVGWLVVRPSVPVFCPILRLIVFNQLTNDWTHHHYQSGLQNGNKSTQKSPLSI